RVAAGDDDRRGGGAVRGGRSGRQGRGPAHDRRGQRGEKRSGRERAAPGGGTHRWIPSCPYRRSSGRGAAGAAVHSVPPPSTGDSSGAGMGTEPPCRRRERISVRSRRGVAVPACNRRSGGTPGGSG